MKTDYPTRVYSNTIDALDALFLNTRVRPFNSLAVRRAVSFAFDRSAAVVGQPIDSLGGGRLTCQVLPPAFPSYRAYCPYSLDPGRGTWTAPDLATAQELVARSGLRGTRVTVVAIPGFRTTAAKILVETLDGLGFPARLKEINTNDYFGAVNADDRVQAGVVDWQADYVSPAQFFQPLFACSAFQPDSPANLNVAEFCDPAIDEEIARAEAAEEANSGTAVSDWTAVDHTVVDEAPWIPIANPEVIDFISRRVGDYQYNPQFGELTDLLWVQ
jgi:peptide/nickel transport system substrate-binding protein